MEVHWAYLVERMHIDARCTNVAEIPFGIVFEIIRYGYPQCLLASLQIVLINDTGYGATLAHAGTIANEKTSPAAIGQEMIVCLRCIRNGLQLQGTQLATVYGFGGYGQFVVDIAWFYRAKRGGLHHGIRMLLPQFHCSQEQQRELVMRMIFSAGSYLHFAGQ